MRAAIDWPVRSVLSLLAVLLVLLVALLECGGRCIAGGGGASASPSDANAVGSALNGVFGRPGNRGSWSSENADDDTVVSKSSKNSDAASTDVVGERSGIASMSSQLDVGDDGRRLPASPSPT
jgi:hypothetical protein